MLHQSNRLMASSINYISTNFNGEWITNSQYVIYKQWFSGVKLQLRRLFSDNLQFIPVLLFMESKSVYIYTFVLLIALIGSANQQW